MAGCAVLFFLRGGTVYRTLWCYHSNGILLLRHMKGEYTPMELEMQHKMLAEIGRCLFKTHSTKRCRLFA